MKVNYEKDEREGKYILVINGETTFERDYISVLPNFEVSTRYTYLDGSDEVAIILTEAHDADK